MLEIWSILKDALFVLLIAMVLSDMRRRDKVNLSRLIFALALLLL